MLFPRSIIIDSSHGSLSSVVELSTLFLPPSPQKAGREVQETETRKAYKTKWVQGTTKEQKRKWRGLRSEEYRDKETDGDTEQNTPGGAHCSHKVSREMVVSRRGFTDRFLRVFWRPSLAKVRDDECEYKYKCESKTEPEARGLPLSHRDIIPMISLMWNHVSGVLMSCVMNVPTGCCWRLDCS